MQDYKSGHFMEGLVGPFCTTEEHCQFPVHITAEPGELSVNVDHLSLSFSTLQDKTYQSRREWSRDIVFSYRYTVILRIVLFLKFLHSCKGCL